MEELMDVCDRILVMGKGSIMAEIPKEDYNQETITGYALQGGE